MWIPVDFKVCLPRGFRIWGVQKFESPSSWLPMNYGTEEAGLSKSACWQQKQNPACCAQPQRSMDRPNLTTDANTNTNTDWDTDTNTPHTHTHTHTQHTTPHHNTTKHKCMHASLLALSHAHTHAPTHARSHAPKHARTDASTHAPRKALTHGEPVVWN